MAIKADFHLHSSFSGDSKTPMEEMIQAAIKKGLTHICFTEHNDMDYPYQPGEEGMFDINTDSYLYELLKLKAKYENQIKVLFGIELGLQPHLKRDFAIYTKNHDFDFIIGSSHVVNGVDPYYPKFFEGKTDQQAYREFLEAELTCIQRIPFFNVYGHLDYVVRYGTSKNQNFSYQAYADLIDEILKTLIEEEKGIELNTAGFREGLGQPNPCADIIKRYRELGGEIITVGSDAHEAANVGADFDKASDILTACGFKYYAIFEGRTPEYFKI